MSAPTVGLALSGGGAAGFGHIAVMEALEEMGVRPAAIAGTSAGAVVGACIAAGIPAADVRARVLEVASAPFGKLRQHLGKSGGWVSAVRGGVDPRMIVDIILPDGVPDTFEDLEIPLSVVVTDFHRRSQAALSEGTLRPALAASSAIPGIFRHVELDGRLYVDGGVTNNLPVELLPDVDICLAVDVASEPPSDPKDEPGPLELVSGSMRIMMQALQEKHVASRDGVILVQPASRKFGALDLRSAEAILEAAKPTRAEVVEKLGSAISRYGA